MVIGTISAIDIFTDRVAKLNFLLLMSFLIFNTKPLFLKSLNVI